MVDGRGAGLQRRGGYRHPDQNQSGLFLAHPDSAFLPDGKNAGAGVYRRLLGNFHLGNLRGAFHPVAFHKRNMESGAGLPKPVVTPRLIVIGARPIRTARAAAAHASYPPRPPMPVSDRASAMSRPS